MSVLGDGYVLDVEDVAGEGKMEQISIRFRIHRQDGDNIDVYTRC